MLSGSELAFDSFKLIISINLLAQPNSNLIEFKGLFRNIKPVTFS